MLQDKLHAAIQTARWTTNCTLQYKLHTAIHTWVQAVTTPCTADCNCSENTHWTLRYSQDPWCVVYCHALFLCCTVVAIYLGDFPFSIVLYDIKIYCTISLLHQPKPHCTALPRSTHAPHCTAPTACVAPGQMHFGFYVWAREKLTVFPLGLETEAARENAASPQPDYLPYFFLKFICKNVFILFNIFFFLSTLSQ